jgi:hypothetical protein
MPKISPTIRVCPSPMEVDRAMKVAFTDSSVPEKVLLAQYATVDIVFMSRFGQLPPSPLELVRTLGKTLEGDLLTQREVAVAGYARIQRLFDHVEAMSAPDLDVLLDQIRSISPNVARRHGPKM